jgi:hypothetical protein
MPKQVEICQIKVTLRGSAGGLAGVATPCACKYFGRDLPKHQPRLF